MKISKVTDYAALSEWVYSFFFKRNRLENIEDRNPTFPWPVSLFLSVRLADSQ